MSITDPSADPVQPEGQGEGGTSDAPYAEYLNRIPEQVRGDVEPIFKEWDANTTKRFQEYADQRKTWERYEPTGVSNHDPEAVQWALQLMQAAQSNPQGFQEWVNSTYAQEHGLQAPTPAVEPETQPLDEFGAFQDPQQLQSLIDQATGPLKQQLEQIQGRIEQQDAAHEQQQLVAKLEGQVLEIEKKIGEPLSEKQKEVLARFASRYDDAETAIPRGWEDMQAFRSEIEKSAFQSKADAPSPAEGGGVPDVNPTQFKRIDDPGVKDAAIEFLRNNNRA